jgi:hypothetical protein
MVDDRVYVRMRGDTIYVDTLSGRDSRDDGSECTGPMPPPRYLSNFQFRGIDGRGDVRLLEDPRQTGREPRVAITDSKGGDEGYTFEWRWTATQGGNWNSGTWGNDGRWNDGRNNDGRNDARWNDGRGRGNNPNRDGRVTWREAMEARQECESAVVSDIRRSSGSSDVRFNSMNADNNPGRRDYINGTGTVRGRGADRDFTFSCQVDLEGGRVRGVDVRPTGRSWNRFRD